MIISVDSNEIKDEGAKALADGLIYNKSLKSFHIRINGSK